MDSNENIYHEVSSTNSENIISILFSEEIISQIAKDYLSYFENDDNNELQIETEQEKYFFTIVSGTNYVRRFTHFNPIIAAAYGISKLDINAIRMNYFVENDSNDNDDYLYIHAFLKNKSYLQTFFKMYNISEEIKQKFINCSNKGKLDEELTTFLFSDEELIKGFITLVAACNIEQYNTSILNKEVEKNQFIKMIRFSESCVHRFHNEYQLWDASVVNKVEMFKYLSVNGHRIKHNIKFDYSIIVLTIFLHFHAVYTQHGEKIIFEDMLKDICKTPLYTARFIKFLKEFEFGEFFCLGYQKYIERTNINPIFSPYIFKSTPLELVKDTEHSEDWFFPIHRSKFIKTSLIDIYNALEKLHSELKMKELIDTDTPLEVFIYRFSGLAEIFKPEFTMKWTGKKYMLAVLIRLLYNDNISRIPYVKIAGFFGIKSNLSQSYKSCKEEAIKDMKEILVRCGFNESKL